VIFSYSTLYLFSQKNFQISAPRSPRSTQVEEAAGSRPESSRSGDPLRPTCTGIPSIRGAPPSARERAAATTAVEDDGETLGGGARPLLRSWRARLLSWSGRGRTVGARAQVRRASPGPVGGGARPAPSRPVDFQIRTVGGEDMF
jgi:hypothetical protein